MHPDLQLIATDISPHALTIAKKQRAKYNLEESLQFYSAKLGTCHEPDSSICDCLESSLYTVHYHT